MVFLLIWKVQVPLDKPSVEAAPTFNTTCSFWIFILTYQQHSALPQAAAFLPLIQV